MSGLIYLSGPSNKTNDPSVPISADWKTYAASTFLKSGITVANPIELDLSGFISSVDESGNAVKYSLNLIDRADSILANIVQITESTTMEIFYAHRQGKRVVVVGNEPFNPWILFHSEKRFSKLREALDYIVSQPSAIDSIAWSNEFESNLVKKSEQYPPIGEPDFEYYGGDLPVLVIAPNSTSFFRDGNLYPSVSYSGSLSVLLHRLTKCHSLIGSHCLAADPMCYLNSPFTTFVGQLIKKANIKLILILRGLEWSNPNDIVLSSWNKSSLINKAEYLNLLTSMLRVKEFKEIGYDSPELISGYGKNIKTLSNLLFEDFSIPTLDIEIHKRYRTPNLHPTLYSNLYTALAQFLMLVGIG